MSWITPVTDRTNADILAKNSKAYMNVSDWARIYDNAEYLKGLAETLLAEAVTFTVIDAPTITTIPTDADVNNLVTNINNINEIVGLTSIPTLKNDWVGNAFPAPNYMQVNQWERNLLAMYNYLSALVPYYAITGVAVCGSGPLWNNRFRSGV